MLIWTHTGSLFWYHLNVFWEMSVDNTRLTSYFKLKYWIAVATGKSCKSVILKSGPEGQFSSQTYLNKLVDDFRVREKCRQASLIVVWDKLCRQCWGFEEPCCKSYRSSKVASTVYIGFYKVYKTLPTKTLEGWQSISECGSASFPLWKDKHSFQSVNIIFKMNGIFL